MSKYELVERTGKPRFKVTIQADMNDGDYLTDIHEYRKDQFERGVLDELIELKKIEGKSGALYDYDEKGYVRIPFDTQSGESCHTLETVEVEYIDENGKLWDVVLKDKSVLTKLEEE